MSIEDEIVICTKCGSEDGYYDFCGYSMDVDGIDFECDCCASCRNDCAADI